MDKYARIRCDKCGTTSDATQIETFFGEDEASETLKCEECNHKWTNVYVFDREEE